MNLLFPVRLQDLGVFGNNWKKFFGWGVALFALGILALCFTTFTTLLSVIILGFFIFASGIIIVMDSLSFWRGKGHGYFLHLLMGILYIVVGLMFIGGPVLGSVSVTLVLAFFYTLLGVTRIYYSLAVRTPNWGWNFFNGIVALLLGVLIMMQWPESSLYIIGLFVGIDLLMCGWAYMMVALAAKGHAK